MKVKVLCDGGYSSVSQEIIGKGFDAIPWSAGYKVFLTGYHPSPLYFCADEVEAIPEDKELLPKECKPRFGHPKFYELLDQMAELHSKKNHDYAGTADPLKNLRASLRLDIDPFMAVLIRLQDKWSRLESLAHSDPMVKGESIKDTLMDNAVYSLLAIILLDEKESK